MAIIITKKEESKNKNKGHPGAPTKQKINFGVWEGRVGIATTANTFILLWPFLLNHSDVRPTSS